MSTADELLGSLLDLPAKERMKLALALLDSVETFDPHAHLSDAELDEELARRADEAVAGGQGVDWETLKSRIRGPHQAE